MLSLAKQLRDAGLACFPCRVKFDSVKNKYEKWPAVPKGVSWQTAGREPLDAPWCDWSSDVVGIEIPPGVVIIDLDLYKGVTPADVDRLLGTSLDWDSAFIQSTINGGAHYAFYTDADIRQGDSIEGLDGFDTRAAARGFICAGLGYTPCVGGGALRLSWPFGLPTLGGTAEQALSKHRDNSALQPQASELQPRNRHDKSRIIEALSHIDPGCGRTQWRNIGYALKAALGDDGADVFESWSSGAYWHAGAPANYVSSGKGSTCEQWPTFKAEGGVGVNTLYWHAMKGGWNPPAEFDASEVFGAKAAPMEAFKALATRVRDIGGDVAEVPALLADINAAGCNELQRALLGAEIQAELKAAGIKDKHVSDHIAATLACAPPRERMTGVYGKNDSANALLFLERNFPNNTIARCDGYYYKYNGKAWEQLTPELYKSLVYRDMLQSAPSESRASACVRMSSNIMPTRDGQLGATPGNLIIFDNGVVDIESGVLMPHSPSLFTTNVLPFAYDWHATCPTWMAFLNDIFDGDVERITLLQQWFGYLLVRDYRHHKILMLKGPPRSGKGTIGRIIAALVGGHNFAGMTLGGFLKDSVLNDISNKPVLFIGDAAKSIPSHVRSSLVEILKCISGNDEITFHRMYHGAVNRALPGRITIASNHIPALFDDSGALAGRVMVLPFYKSFLGREDVELEHKLLAEISGVANWSLAGWHSLKQAGKFIAPLASEYESRLIQESYSPILQFVAECCRVEPGARTSLMDVYDVYRAWSLRRQEDLVKPNMMRESLRDSLSGRGVRFLDGIFHGLAVEGVGNSNPILQAVR